MQFRRNSVKYLTQTFLLAMVLVTCSGCITASLATIGTILGAVGSAASTGSEVYSLGKLDASVMGSYASSQLAVTAAADDLQLHLCSDDSPKKYPDIKRYLFEDDLGAKFKIQIERRTSMMCRCRVDVGFFGSEPTARLILDRIRWHLPHMRNESIPGDSK